MPKSSKHKSHKRKYSSKDYSDSEDDVVKTKDKSVRDESSSRVRHDSSSGEKRKMSSHSREEKGEVWDLSGHDNGEVLEDNVSSKRRKEKLDVVDRWSGDENERLDGDRNLEKELHVEVNLKGGSRSKESSDKGESFRIESKSKTKKYESGNVNERKEESLTPVLLDKEDGSAKGDSKRKHEKDYLSRKDGKESKEKHRRSDREKNGGGEIKNGAEVKLVDSDYGKEIESQSGDLGEEKQSKRALENTERTMMDDLQSPDSEYELDKRSRRRREDSSDRDKYYDDLRKVEDRRLPSKNDRVKDIKHRDDKQKDGGYADKYRGDHYKHDKRRDEKYRDEADKDYYYYSDKYHGDGEKDYKSRDDRHRENIKRSNRHKDGKLREDDEGGSQRKYDKQREGFERDCRRDTKYQEDGHKDSRLKDFRYDEDGDKEGRRADEKHHSHGGRDGRHKDQGYGDDGSRDYRKREEKYREDIERDTHQYDSKKMDDFDKKRHRDTKYRDEYDSRDHFGDKSEQKRSRDDVYAGSHHSRKSTAYDDSPTHDDRTPRYRAYENENDSRSRVGKDQRSDARPELGADRGRSTYKTSEVELTSSHSRRRGSPTASSYAPRDYYRSLNPDESKYRDYKQKDRVRLDKTSNRDYVVGSGKIPPSQSLEQLCQKDDGYVEVLSAERCVRSDIRSSPQQIADKSPSPSMGRRDISRQESTPKGGGSREEKQYSAKDVRGSRESGIDIPRGDELSQADADSLSISSPFMRNSHLSGSSKPPPPPFRTGQDSPLPLGSAEDDARGRPHVRQRKIGGDPNVGRISGHGWRGVTSWPSPVANGFLSFPHAPPVAFPSVAMQPYPSPPMFGVHPSMELNSSIFGPGRPMGWRNQVNDPFPSLHAWDASNAVFGQDVYGRPDCDRSRILPTGLNRDEVGDFSKGLNRTESLERPLTERENNNSGRIADEVSADDVQVDSSTIDASLSKNIEKNDAEVPMEEKVRDAEEILKKDDVCFGQVYLSRLDISADLAEPELFDKCTGLMNLDRDILSDVDDVKFLYVEDAMESKRASHRLLSYELFEAVDESVYKKSISLYKRDKESSYAEDGNKSTLLSGLVVDSHNGGEPEKVLNPRANEEDCLQNVEETTIEESLVSDLGQQVQGKPLSEEEEEEEKGEYSDSNNIDEESKLIDSKCGPPLVISDMSSEAVNISRIHNHSPESAH